MVLNSLSIEKYNFYEKQDLFHFRKFKTKSTKIKTTTSGANPIKHLVFKSILDGALLQLRINDCIVMIYFVGLHLEVPEKYCKFIMKRIWYSVCYYSKTIVLHQTFQSKVEAALCDHFWVRSKVITITDDTKAAYIEIRHTNSFAFLSIKQKCYGKQKFLRSSQIQ